MTRGIHESRKQPGHIGIIMDGNGRWAEQQSKTRVEGHKQGAKTAIEVTKWCRSLGVKTLSLYALSTENMTRSKSEVSFIINLLIETLKIEKPMLIKERISVRLLGDCSVFDKALSHIVEEINTGIKVESQMKLNIAFNYSGRWHIEQCMWQIIESNVLKNKEEMCDKFRLAMMSDMDTDPDLLIRTGNEKRLSNFMLWHLAYTELYFDECFWPAFTHQNFTDAIRAFGMRQRRFGQVVSPTEV